MPLKQGKKHMAENFHELRNGKQFKRTAQKLGKKKAVQQMTAIALKTSRKRPRKSA